MDLELALIGLVCFSFVHQLPIYKKDSDYSISIKYAVQVIDVAHWKEVTKALKANGLIFYEKVSNNFKIKKKL